MDIDKSKAINLYKCTEIIRSDIGSRRITKELASKVFQDIFGSSSKDGLWHIRDLSEAVEVASATFFRDRYEIIAKMPILHQFASIAAIQGTIFNQSARSETQISFDQFSTPPILSWICSKLIDAKPNERILEPHAGTGMMSAFIDPQANLIFNEIEQGRGELLSLAYPDATIVKQDALQLSCHEIASSYFSKIIMNPPFTAVKGCGKKRGTSVRHLKAMMELLAPGGKLVALMPGNFGEGSHSRNFLSAIKDRYQVSHLFEVGERIYRVHGVNFPMKIIAIEKSLPSKATYLGKI